MKEFGEFLRRNVIITPRGTVYSLSGGFRDWLLPLNEERVQELSRKLLSKVFHLVDEKSKIKKSYQVTETLIKKVVIGVPFFNLKVKFREEIYSQKGTICKNRVKFQDLSVLEKKLGRALY